MIDICFNDSAAGLLLHSGLAVRENLHSVSFDLSVGDILSPIVSGDCPQRQSSYEWLSADPWGELGDRAAQFEQFWCSVLTATERVKELAKVGTPLRMWVDSTPQCMCNFYYITSLLDGVRCDITVVKLADIIEDSENGTKISYKGWGEVSPDKFNEYRRYSAPFTAHERAAVSEKWRTLTVENAHLRAVQNGEIVSAPLDYYDDIIRSEYPSESCKVAYLIGTVLGGHALPIHDSFIAGRIRHLIDKGELTITQTDEKRFYNAEIAINC